ncbi:MAG: hypothetical protein R3277_01250 [Brumimicrobium sp.]|nr:hypothetical protein [Brumimicrobium sp.]
MKNIIVFLFSVAILCVACDKNKRASKRLMRPGTWNVVELSVDGANLSPLPVWQVNDCDIYDTSLCTSSWILEGIESQFYWQFNDKAERFNISRVVDTADCSDFYTEEVEQQTYNFSGAYKVIESKRKRKEFESYSTLGYPGKKVVIRLEQ